MESKVQFLPQPSHQQQGLADIFFPLSPDRMGVLTTACWQRGCAAGSHVSLSL